MPLPRWRVDRRRNPGAAAIGDRHRRSVLGRGGTPAPDKLSVNIKVAQIGGDYVDTDDAWAAVAEIDDGGAIPVRPDNHVAWRGRTRDDNPEHALTGALATILARD